MSLMSEAISAFSASSLSILETNDCNCSVIGCAPFVSERTEAALGRLLDAGFGRLWLVEQACGAAVVLVLPAIAIATTTGLNVYVSVILMGLLTTVYTTVGGFKAGIWTEVFQGALKFMAPIAMIVVCLISLPGGVSAQRFKLVAKLMGSDTNQWLAIYDFEGDDPMALLGAMGERAKSGQMTPATTQDMATTYTALFTEYGEEVKA